MRGYWNEWSINLPLETTAAAVIRPFAVQGSAQLHRRRHEINNKAFQMSWAKAAKEPQSYLDETSVDINQIKDMP